MSETETTANDANQEAANNRAEMIEDSSTSTTATPESVQKSKPEGDNIPKTRFNKVYWEKKQAERERDELKLKLEQQTLTQAQPPEPETGKPTLEQFDYDDTAYYEALADYKADQKIKAAFKARDEQAQVERQKSEAEMINKSFQSKLSEYVSKNPEYNDAIEAAGHKAFAPHVNQAILHADNGPAIDHHLLVNPDVADKLSQMNPVQAAIEIGKIGVELSAKPVKQTSAPAPIETVGGGGTPNVDKRYDENCSMEEYYKASLERGRRA